KHRSASSVVDVCAVCVRLSARFRRFAHRRAACRSRWRARALRAAALPGKLVLHRRAGDGSGWFHLREAWRVRPDAISMPRQLALALPHAENFSREDFLTGTSNEAAINLVERWPDWPDRALAIVGPEGAGKSHLATIWADFAGARRLSARLLGETNLPVA